MGLIRCHNSTPSYSGNIYEVDRLHQGYHAITNYIAIASILFPCCAVKLWEVYSAIQLINPSK